ncbi:MAG: cell division topological specificity factor MinE [Halanaerobiales bacterium]
MGFGKSKKKSKETAKERLQFVLVHDRINLSPEEMKSLRKELLEVLNKYIEVDEDNVKMEVNQREEIMALIANFPFTDSNER